MTKNLEVDRCTNALHALRNYARIMINKMCMINKTCRVKRLKTLKKIDFFCANCAKI